MSVSVDVETPMNSLSAGLGVGGWTDRNVWLAS